MTLAQSLFKRLVKVSNDAADASNRSDSADSADRNMVEAVTLARVVYESDLSTEEASLLRDNIAPAVRRAAGRAKGPAQDGLRDATNYLEEAI